MQGVGDAAGQAAGVEKGPFGSPQGGPVGLLEEDCQGAGKEKGRGELDPGQLDAVGFFQEKVVDDQDVQGEEDGTAEDQEVAERNLEIAVDA